MRDYTKFYTPDKLASYLVRLVGPNRCRMRYLEPHAGDGSIVKAIKRRCKGKVWAVEMNQNLDSTRRKVLHDAGADVVTMGNFLTIPIESFRGGFDRIIANPPFGNGIDLDAHFNKMYFLLKRGGKMVAICPDDFEPHFDGLDHRPLMFYRPIENWAVNSDGTTTPIKIILLQKD